MKYSQDEIDFIKANAPKYTYKELTLAFNTRFEKNKSVSSIWQFCTKTLNISAKLEKIRYSEKEKTFLIENIKKYSYSELTDLFYQKFKRKVSKSQLSDLCNKQLNISRDANTGKFTKGKKPSKYMIGDEIVRNDGYVMIKYNEEYIPGKATSREYKKNWMLKQKFLYEKTYGPIEDDNFIIFLDKNKRNFDISNLYCVNRKVHAMMCSNGWYSENKDITLTAIKYCELMQALK